MRIFTRLTSTMSLLFVLAFVAIGTQRTDAAAAALKPHPACNEGFILCGGQSIDLTGTPENESSWIYSGLGTGRFGLSCSGYRAICLLLSQEYNNGWQNTFSVQLYYNYPKKVYMHGSGNLVVLDDYDYTLWQSSTTMSETDAYLNIHDSGCAAIWHENDSSTVWDSCN